jgi:hypothetical protein
MSTWSWSQLLAEAEGDEERALFLLSEVEGWGSYQDDVHRPMERRTLLTAKGRAAERERKRRDAAQRRAVMVAAARADMAAKR